MRLLHAVAVLAVAACAFAADKPSVVFSRPENCFEEKLKFDPCAAFEASVQHPAMKRRLAGVTFETVIGMETFLAVNAPDGREAMRWYVMPTWLNLSEILTLLDIAWPHLQRAHAATDPAEAEREWAIAVLAFGDRTRGRALLHAMRNSPSHENRELAAVWLERVDTLDSEEPLAKLAREGSTGRVRFEAWMAIGDLRVEQARYEEAIDAFDRAAALMPQDSIARRAALAARQNATTLNSPVLGLGAPGTVIAGRRSIRLRGPMKNVKTVEYRLDGRLVATAKRAPFVAAVNFGRIPQRQLLEIVSKGARGNVMTRARVIVNERADAFAVDIVEPSAHELSGAVDVVVAARVPSGRSVEELTVEWNGKRVARFTTPPYRTRIDIRGDETGVLRTVLRLDDGSETEDALLVNTMSLVMEAGAHLVEVPAYFEGAPAERDVTVREAGKPRAIEQVIRPEDAPLLIGLLIDSSGSMTEHMLDLQEAAIRFLEQHLDPRDRTMLVTFDATAQVRVRPTSDRTLVERAILRMRPRGGTALNDAIITALLQMQAPGSRKALVVFSDGYDVSSVFSHDDGAEVARRAGVPIYVLAFTPELGPQAARLGRTTPTVPLDRYALEMARKELIAISTRTGAKGFEMTTLDDLGAHWAEIGADVRKQSLVIYRTETAGAEWRTLEISANGKPVRAPAGVYVTAGESR